MTSPASPAATPPPARTSRVRIFFNGFAVGVLLTGAVVWYVRYQSQLHPEAQQRFQQASSAATDAAGEALYHASVALRSKMETLDLKPEQVQEELARAGKIVRRRARELASQAADAGADTLITTAIKTRFAADRELSVWSISVSTTDGRVTLDGTVQSPEQLAQAVALAMEADGVREVTSNLKLEPKKP
ncbi:MAG: BON domain-containing protein [Opitutaceae bacterium]|nr:BON domain-containing protein [Opitutaceae bacterium]